MKPGRIKGQPSPPRIPKGADLSILTPEERELLEWRQTRTLRELASMWCTHITTLHNMQNRAINKLYRDIYSRNYH